MLNLVVSKLTEITASIFSKDSRKLSRKLLLVAYLENFSEPNLPTCGKQAGMEAVIFVPSLKSKSETLLACELWITVWGVNPPTSKKIINRFLLADYGPIFNAGDKRGQLILWRKGKTPNESSNLIDETPILRQNPVQVTDNSRTSMTLKELKRTVRSFLARDRSEDALDFITNALKEDATIQRTIIMQFGRLSRLRKDLIHGTTEQNSAETRRNTINSAIASMLEDIEEEDLLPNNNLAGGSARVLMSDEERKGIERAIGLHTSVINALREKLALEDDPIRQIRYEKELSEREAELVSLKAKLA